MRPATALAIAVLVVLAGCGATSTPDAASPTPSPSGTEAPTESTDRPTETDTSTTTPTDAMTATATATETDAAPTPTRTRTGTPTRTRTRTRTTTETATPSVPQGALSVNDPPDPYADAVGWEGGYWHNESVAVDNSDGLNETERQVAVRRIVARIEVILDEELDHGGGFEFEFISREQLRERIQFPERPYRDQVLEATFLVGENRSAGEAKTALWHVVVDGLGGGGGGTFVVEDTESPRLDPAVLAHEVGHSSYVWESEDPMRAFARTDDRITTRSMIEGFPDWIEDRYLERCGQQWECIERPDQRPPTQDVNEGLYVKFAAPYVLGDQLMEAEGPQEVWRRQPTNSEQLIHPEKWRTDERTMIIDVRDRSGEDWTPMEMDRSHRNLTQDRIGEVMLYTMFWNRGLTDDPDSVTVTIDQENGLDYEATPSAGWDGDGFVAYTNGTAYGYVFETAWDTERDAREFHSAYLELLEGLGAERVGEGIWVIDSGPFADAFRVVRTDARVSIVNAPTVDALDEVHATG